MASDKVQLTIPQQKAVYAHLDGGSYLQRYSEEVERITSGISDPDKKQSARQALKLFEVSQGKLIQSSPYMLSVLNSLLPVEKTLVDRVGLQAARKADSGFMSGDYVDIGLNAVPENVGNRVNAVQANVLETSLKQAGVSLKDPRLVPYHILKLGVNLESPCGLVFELSEKGKDTAKDFVLHTDDFSWIYKPQESENGLFRAFLDCDGSWDCYGRGLGGSDRGGGVVVESAEGTSQKVLHDAIRKRNSARAKYFAELRAVHADVEKELAKQ